MKITENEMKIVDAMRCGAYMYKANSMPRFGVSGGWYVVDVPENFSIRNGAKIRHTTITKLLDAKLIRYRQKELDEKGFIKTSAAYIAA